MVPLPRHLVLRSVPLVRIWLWHRLVRRLWVGLASLGVQLAWWISNLWRWPVLLAEHHILQPDQFLRSRTRRSLRGARRRSSPRPQREHRRAWRSLQPSRRNHTAFQRKYAGGSRKRCSRGVVGCGRGGV